MRKIWFAIGLPFALLSSAHAQVPVTITSDVPATMFHFEDMAQWAQQLAQMKLQIEQLQTTYSSINGIRGMGKLFNMPDAWKYLPGDWQQVYSDLESGKVTSLTGSIKDIRASYSTFERSKLSDPKGEIGALYDRSWNNAGVAKSFSAEGYKQASDRLTKLQGLLDQVDQSTDEKDILDLQGRIQAEQAMIQNEHAKLALVQQLANAEDQLQQQSLTDMAFRSLGSNDIAIRRSK